MKLCMEAYSTETSTNSLYVIPVPPKISTSPFQPKSFLEAVTAPAGRLAGLLMRTVAVREAKPTDPERGQPPDPDLNSTDPTNRANYGRSDSSRLAQRSSRQFIQHSSTVLS